MKQSSVRSTQVGRIGKQGVFALVHKRIPAVRVVGVAGANGVFEGSFVIVFVAFLARVRALGFIVGFTGYCFIGFVAAGFARNFIRDPLNFPGKGHMLHECKLARLNNKRHNKVVKNSPNNRVSGYYL